MQTLLGGLTEKEGDLLMALLEKAISAAETGENRKSGGADES
jgi:hypothetical protein